MSLPSCPHCGSEACWFAGDRDRVREHTLWEVRQAIASDLDASHFSTVAFGELDRMLDRLAATVSAGAPAPSAGWRFPRPATSHQEIHMLNATDDSPPADDSKKDDDAPPADDKAPSDPPAE